MRKVIVCGGKVYASDGDIHRIGPGRLAQLYGLPMSKCSLAVDLEHLNRMMLGPDRPTPPVLYPRQDGNYTLPYRVKEWLEGTDE